MVKLLLIASAHGGSGKTTACVRLAECFAEARIPAAIVDLSPHSAAPYMTRLPVIAGRGATTEAAARAIIRPHEEKVRVLLADTGDFADPAIKPWLGLVHSMLLVTRISRLAVSALPTIWPALDEARRAHPSLQFAGVVPMMVTPPQGALCLSLRQRLKDSIHAESIPFDPFEHQRLQRSCFDGMEALPATNPGLEAWRRSARILAQRMQLEPIVAPPEPKPAGALGALANLWRRAIRGGSSPSVRVAGGSA